MILLLLKASILLVVLYLFYKWVLERESFFAINRVFLVGSLLLCFVLPFVSLPMFSSHQGIVTTSYESWVSPEVVATSPAPADIPITTNLEPITPPLPPSPTPAHSSKLRTAAKAPMITLPDWQTWIWYIYLFGASIFLLRLVTQVGSLLWKIRNNTDRIEDIDHTIINVYGEQEPCSFFHYILINPEKYVYETYEEILSHERIHVRQGHSFDLLLAEVGSILLWFHPLAWLFRREIEKNIEYQTDDLWLLENQAARERYQMNLLRVATQHHPLTVTTNYNQSLIKQRILRMNAKKSNPHSIWKYAFALPVLFVVLLLLNTPNTFGAPDPTLVTDEAAVPAQTEQQSNTSTPDEKLMIQQVEDSIPTNQAILDQCEELEEAVRVNDLTRIRQLLEEVGVECLVNQKGITLDDVRGFLDLVDLGTDLQIDPEGKLLEIGNSLAHLEQLANATPLYPIEPPADTEEEAECRALTEAIKAQDVDKVRNLLKTTDPNCSHIDLELQENYYNPRRSPLVTAAQLGNLEIAKLLLGAGAEVEYHGDGEYTPIMAAAEYGHLNMVKYLQEEGASINTNMDGYGTPLVRAAKSGNIKLITYLLDEGVNVNASGLGIGTALLMAARKGNNEVVQLLLDRDAKMDVRVDGVGTALSVATRNAQHQAMEILIAAGANVDATGAGVGTPLMEAARKDDTKALDLLLEAGANPDTRAPGVGTALSMASRKGKVQVASRLIEAGANPNLAAAGVGTPLMQAARNQQDAALELLLSKGASPDAEAPGVGTALSMAARAGDRELMEKLMVAGADPDLAAPGVGTPLIMAVRKDDQATVNYLLDQGADADAQAPGVGTPLSTAVRAENIAMAKLLLARKADPDAAADGILPPLFEAARKGNYEITKLLLESGADPNQVTYMSHHRTAKETAQHAGHGKIIELLDSHGAQ